MKEEKDKSISRLLVVLSLIAISLLIIFVTIGIEQKDNLENIAKVSKQYSDIFTFFTVPLTFFLVAIGGIIGYGKYLSEQKKEQKLKIEEMEKRQKTANTELSNHLYGLIESYIKKYDEIDVLSSTRSISGGHKEKIRNNVSEILAQIRKIEKNEEIENIYLNKFEIKKTDIFGYDEK